MDPTRQGCPQFTLRLNTQDPLTLHEVFWQNEYGLPKRFEPDDLIIDVGANIGAFALACLVRGTKRIDCYEPESDNFELLAKNTAGFGPGPRLHRHAIWDGGGNVSLADRGAFTACHSIATEGDLSGVRRVPVKTKTLDQCLSSRGKVRLLKMDCEGSEWASLHRSRLLTADRIQEVAIELHTTITLVDRECTPQWAVEEMVRRGFKRVDANPSDPKGINWLLKAWRE